MAANMIGGDEWTDAGAPSGHELWTEDTWATLAERLHLARRELEVLRGVFDDHKDQRIACDLGISAHTVRTYLQRMYFKLDVHSRPMLIVRLFAEHQSLQRGLAEQCRRDCPLLD